MCRHFSFVFDRIVLTECVPAFSHTHKNSVIQGGEGSMKVNMYLQEEGSTVHKYDGTETRPTDRPNHSDAIWKCLYISPV